MLYFLSKEQLSTHDIFSLAGSERDDIQYG
jgi:hypothetical protein